MAEEAEPQRRRSPSAPRRLRPAHPVRSSAARLASPHSTFSEHSTKVTEGLKVFFFLLVVYFFSEKLSYLQQLYPVAVFIVVNVNGAVTGIQILDG